MKYIVNLLLLSAAMFAMNASAKEISTSKLSVIAEQMEGLDERDLIVTDVKGVLFYQSDSLISPNHKDRYMSFLDRVKEESGKQRRDMLDSIVRKSYVPVPVDQGLLDLLNEKRADGANFIALTSGRTGPYGAIKDRTQMRLERLEALGINFGTNFARTSANLEVSEMAEGKPSYFRNNVIFVNRNSKGESLLLLLKLLEFKPRKLIVIDNEMRQVDDIRKFVESEVTEFIGIHYTKVFEHHAGPLDEKIAQKQLAYLERRSIWLSDAEARCMIEKNDDLQLCKNNKGE